MDRNRRFDNRDHTAQFDDDLCKRYPQKEPCCMGME